MMRTQIVKLTRAPVSLRTFTTTALRASEGDTGGVRPGGQQSGDAFSKREQASEAMFIREKERQTLEALKAKLKQQRQHLDELDNHIKELESTKAGRS